MTTLVLDTGALIALDRKERGTGERSAVQELQAQFGVPVVAWESGGIGEWAPGPGLVRWGDVEALARALADAVNRRVTQPPRFERDEAIGRLLAIYARM